MRVSSFVRSVQLVLFFLFLLAGSRAAQAGWYLDSLKKAPIIEIRGESSDTTVAKAAGDRLIEDNFDYLLANNEWLIVNFCAYWCGDCNTFMPFYIRASKQRKYVDISWAVADVDGVRGNEGFRKRFTLPGTPTVILFHNGAIVRDENDSPVILDGHKGDKSYDDLIVYLKSNYRP